METNYTSLTLNADLLTGLDTQSLNGPEDEHACSNGCRRNSLADFCQSVPLFASA